MNIRHTSLGSQNLIGATVTQLRRNCGMSQKDLLAQMQIHDADINATSLSKLEGQTRCASDREVVAIAKIFGITPNELLHFQE